MKPIKRAIALAGGGPAVGLSIGTLKRVYQEPDIRFDVWSLACIGAWLGIVWNQTDPGHEVEQSIEFFKGIFRPDDVYDKFPIAAAFAPDFAASIRNVVDFALNPKSYENLIIPDAILSATEELMRFVSDPRQWTNSNLNTLILNQVLAVNPLSRFATSMMYKSDNKGLARVYYQDSALLNAIRFERLYEDGKPVLYHNAYNLSDKSLELFSNKNPLYQRISGHTLCACSALPYIEEPVVIDGKMYCEGATVDTVNFEDLMRNHPDLDEVWVSRILDVKQVRKPANLYDSLNNLVMLFAATTSEDDVKLFKYHVAKTHPDLKVIEVPVAFNIDYDWSYSNLDRAIHAGYKATDKVVADYRAGRIPPVGEAMGFGPVSRKENPAKKPVRTPENADA